MFQPSLDSTRVSAERNGSPASMRAVRPLPSPVPNANMPLAGSKRSVSLSNIAPMRPESISSSPTVSTRVPAGSISHTRSATRSANSRSWVLSTTANC